MSTVGGASVDDMGEKNVLITTMTPKQIVMEWASRIKISLDTVQKLFEEGFMSLEAICLLDVEDFSMSKIPQGQKKLLEYDCEFCKLLIIYVKVLQLIFLICTTSLNNLKYDS